MIQSKTYIYNTLTRGKELFTPANPPHVGLYVCGPTVYGDPHLGHARPAIVFDLLFRYLKHLGYKVRYVRNITDVGHLEHDADEGEDKIAKKARAEKLVPMEVAQHYTNRYLDSMRALNVLPPSIEPRASGHIIEQQEMVRRILSRGFAYERNGSVYFDMEKYLQKHRYGQLSGRKPEELITNTRELEKQKEKKNPLDFALWKKADPAHIMNWPSEWSRGFPGWHLECSAMSRKYLGEVVDIHGGGLDLIFPHHECEIAQSVASTGREPVRYWMHNNVITLEGRKMSKSLGNTINLEQFFTGSHQLLDQAYSPMTVRFFTLQAHYRSTLDFSNQALKAAEKGLDRLFEGIDALDRIEPSGDGGDPGGSGGPSGSGGPGGSGDPSGSGGPGGSGDPSGSGGPSLDVSSFRKACYEALNDDLNSAVLLSGLFEGIRHIHLAREGSESFTAGELKELKNIYRTFTGDVLGLHREESVRKGDGLEEELIRLITGLRQQARQRKDFSQSDQIRDRLNELGIEVRDTPGGVEWKKK